MKRETYLSTIVCLFIGIALLLQFVSCSTVALSGRKQLNLISDRELMTTSSQQYKAFLRENKLSNSGDQSQMVKHAGRRIQSAVERYFRQQGQSNVLAGYAWEFNLIENKEPNAWCMPGGKVVFYSGILPICRNETGVAVVMGHEVAHAVANHGGERMSQSLLAQLGGQALSAALQSKPQQTQQLWMTAFGAGAQYGALLPFSRTQESEADHLGLIFMAMAGYDPDEALAFWQRMSAQQGGQAPEFMSSHPSDQSRISNIKAHLPEARKYYKPN
ncbi:M48 family metallopeptidase [bacterium]|nr:M48 family metallopeptidase [bacterium]